MARYSSCGGGIFIDESGVKIENNLIRNNRLDYKNGTSGGGICALKNKDGERYIIIRNNLIIHNSIKSDFSIGGGIYIGWEEKPILNYLIENNDISFNINENTDAWKAMGGGIALECILPSTGLKIVRNNIIRANEARCEKSFGGGIYIIDWDDLTATTTTVYDSTPNPLFYNNIICDNYSEYMGGGISIWRGDWWNAVPCDGAHIHKQPVFINNTIVNNRSQDGWGFFIMNYVPLFMNNIIWNRSISGNGGEIYMGNIPGHSDWNNLYGDVEMFYCDIQGGWEGEGNIDSDPLFADSANYYLSAESPCIDAGHDSSIFNDIENGGVAVWPAMGTMRNDMGVYGGNPDSIYHYVTVIDKYVSVNNTRASNFKLQQNYPNPFNPSTTIEFQIPNSEFTTLKVYNILGKEVTTLVSKKLNPGNHTYRFDGENIASGVYYYSIVAGEYREVRKMVLLK